MKKVGLPYDEIKVQEDGIFIPMYNIDQFGKCMEVLDGSDSNKMYKKLKEEMFVCETLGLTDYMNKHYMITGRKPSKLVYFRILLSAIVSAIVSVLTVLNDF